MFYSSFIVGFENLVKEIIEKKYKNIKIKKVFNGGIIYSKNNIPDIPYFNNNFFVFKYSKENNIIKFIKNLNSLNLKRSKKCNSFRVIISDQNNLVSIDRNLLCNLEKKITKETGNFLNRKNPDIEYWVLKRSEGYIMFMQRINKHKSFDKILNKGELRSDLCSFLNYLSNPNAQDIFLDCFCGSGAIVKNRIRDKYNMVFGIDINKNHINLLRHKFKKKNNIIFKNINFFKNTFENEFIDKIVTDPPWGIFENIENLDGFYREMFQELIRILKKGGILVMLTACKKEAEMFSNKLILIQKFDILVSGKKAAVFVMKKI